MIPRSEIERKQTFLKARLNKRYIKWAFTPPGVSLLEAALCRGGRGLAPVIRSAYEKGACLDAWSEHFNLKIWEDAFTKHGLELDECAMRSYGCSSPLPWVHIDLAVPKTTPQLANALELFLTGKNEKVKA